MRTMLGMLVGCWCAGGLGAAVLQDWTDVRGGATAGVFDDDEVAALALGGTRPRDLHHRPRTPDEPQAGCAFRGPQGCTLPAVDRPNLCVRFACRELETELRASGDWERVRALTKQLETAFARFTRASRA